MPVRADGTVDPEEVKKKLSPQVAAIMLTNPNTCGLFERDVAAIAQAVHAAGAYFYADANFNAIVGKVRPGDLAVEGDDINLEVPDPHGGGRRARRALAALLGHAPPMMIDVDIRDAEEHTVASSADELPSPLRGGVGGGGSSSAVGIGVTPTPNPSPQGGGGPVGDRRPLGRMCAFHGQMGMFVRALAYMLSHGSDGMRQASEDAVLNANYVRASSLADLMSQPFGNRPCMHEALFDDHWLEGTGVTTLDFAKAMIDEGYHPMTMYFPLVVHGAMLIEPTKSESKASLDALHRRPARPGQRPKPATPTASTQPRYAPAAASTKPRPRASRS